MKQTRTAVKGTAVITRPEISCLYLGDPISVIHIGATVPATVVATPTKKRPTMNCGTVCHVSRVRGAFFHGNLHPCDDAWITTPRTTRRLPTAMPFFRPTLSMKEPRKGPVTTAPALMMAALSPIKLLVNPKSSMTQIRNSVDSLVDYHLHSRYLALMFRLLIMLAS